MTCMQWVEDFVRLGREIKVEIRTLSNLEIIVDLLTASLLRQTFLGLSRVPPHERLLNGQATSVHWRLAFVSKEPIRCSVSVDLSVVCQAVCHVLMHCLGSSILHDICFRGAKCGK